MSARNAISERSQTTAWPMTMRIILMEMLQDIKDQARSNVGYPSNNRQMIKVHSRYECLSIIGWIVVVRSAASARAKTTNSLAKTTSTSSKIAKILCVIMKRSRGTRMNMMRSGRSLAMKKINSTSTAGTAVTGLRNTRAWTSIGHRLVRRLTRQFLRAQSSCQKPHRQKTTRKLPNTETSNLRAF